MEMRSILLSLVVLAGAGLGGPALADCKLAKLPDLQVTMRGPRALVHASVDGVDGLFMVDTGAFFSSATGAAVARFNLKQEPAPFGLYVTGIGHGETQISVASVKDFIFDGLPFHRIDFIVLDRRLGEDLDGSIGENILGAPDVEYDLGDGAIRLFQSTGCGNADLAYWVTDQTDSVVDNQADGKLEPPKTFATLNGVRIRVAFDSGSPPRVTALLAGTMLPAGPHLDLWRPAVSPHLPTELLGSPETAPGVMRLWIVDGMLLTEQAQFVEPTADGTPRGVSRVYVTWGDLAGEGATPAAAARNLLASGVRGAAADTTLMARWEFARRLAAEADSAAAAGDLEAFGRFYGELKRLLGVRGKAAAGGEHR